MMLSSHRVSSADRKRIFADCQQYMPQPAVHELLVLGTSELIGITVRKEVKDIPLLEGEAAAVE